MGDLIKYGKRWVIVNMIARAALVAAVVVPLVAMVAAGGGELHITWSLGQ